jgi:outer membrane usher protein
VNDIAGDGLSAKFDVQSLALILDLPVPLRRVQEINVGTAGPHHRSRRCPQNSPASYQYAPTNYVGEPGGNLDVSRLPSGEQATGAVFYNANRFEASLSENALLPSSGGVSDGSQQTNLRVGTSLAFADGYFGIGRPIGDSFAIAALNENYADQNIIVDGSGSEGKFEAKTDFLGAAVQPDPTAYQIQPLLAAIPDLPIGYQLDRDRFQVLPTYLSGMLIVIGNDATVVLDGTLMDRNGAPLALLAGEIVNVDRKGAPVVAFFTNRMDRFRIEGVGPGAFELRLAADPAAQARVVIPPKTKGVYVVGKIKLETEAGEER